MKFFLSVFFSFLVVKSFAQIQEMKLESKFDYALEISSIAFVNESIWLTAEKCKQVFILDKQSFKIIDVKDLDNGILTDKRVELEGAVFYKNYVFFADEYNGLVFDYNCLYNRLDEVNVDCNLSEDKGDYGIEGIAIDASNGFCYLLKEKVKEHPNQSVIRVFKMIESQEKISLEFKQNITIEHEDVTWRYTDLVYNSKNKYLYCLRTKLGQYQIDTISAKFYNAKNDTVLTYSPQRLFKDISYEVNAFGESGFGTNLEGIAINGKFLYLVSDNSQDSIPKCNIPGLQRTLLVKIAL